MLSSPVTASPHVRGCIVGSRTTAVAMLLSALCALPLSLGCNSSDGSMSGDMGASSDLGGGSQDAGEDGGSADDGGVVLDIGMTQDGGPMPDNGSGGQDQGVDMGPVGGCGTHNCAGCCDGDFCLAGTIPGNCGQGGVACVDCNGTDQCVSGTCEPCSASNCSGCCSTFGCETGDRPTACGGAGTDCVDCNDYESCEAGTCTPCDSSNCAGCCDFLGECLTGDEFFACGQGGEQCDRCTFPESCDSNACTPRACSATAPSRGVDGGDDCGPAGREYVCDCPDNIVGCSGDGVCASQFELRFRFRVATVSFDPAITYDPPSVPWDITTEPDPIVLLEAGNTTLLMTDVVEGVYYHEYDPLPSVVRGVPGLPRLRVTLYDADFPGLSERLECTFSLDEAEDVRARRILCEHADNDTYVELFVEPQ